MTVKFTILGCGSSGGVPRIGNDWGMCDPTNPKNRRRRCSIMVEQINAEGTTRVIIDTSPDMREQMLSADVSAIDAVWYTHEHADHTHGIDELRVFYLRQRQRVPVYADTPTAEMLMNRFSYCFVSPQGKRSRPKGRAAPYPLCRSKFITVILMQSVFALAMWPIRRT
jgi:phosphoribosyl 1,2-cyclic phosphate phosphodiesterase